MRLPRTLLCVIVLSLLAPLANAKVPTRKGWFGIRLAAATSQEQLRIGVKRPVPRVTKVFAGSPALTSGVRIGDFVIAFQGVPVKNLRDLITRVGAQAPGTEVGITLHRDGAPKSIRVVLDLRPDMRALFKKQWVGRRMPAVAVKDIETGAQVDLSPEATRGRVILVDYFATWCGPCRRVMPHLDRYQRVYGPRGLEVVGVSTEKHEVVKAWEAKHPLGYTVATDDSKEFRKAMTLSVLPTIWVVDREGVIKEIFFGAGHEAQVEALVRTTLGVSTASGPFKRGRR